LHRFGTEQHLDRHFRRVYRNKRAAEESWRFASDGKKALDRWMMGADDRRSLGRLLLGIPSVARRP
jgi:hypothetical protein